MQTDVAAGADRPRSAVEEQFDERRLQVLVRFSTALRWPMLSAALVMAAVGWTGTVPPPLVIAWLALTLAVREARAAALVRLGRDGGRAVARRLRLTAAWTFLLGAAHGSAALWMLRLDTASAAILTMVLMSLSAGAVSTTFTVFAAFVAYAAAISVPTALMWAIAGGWLGWSLAALVLMFFGVQVRYARQNMQLFDESYRMRLENQALLKQLSDERAQLAQARDAAVQADLSKSRFLAAASHDLRQPLQSLLLNSGALLRRPLEADSHAIASEMAAGSDALRQMLDALLDVSKLDAGVVVPSFAQISLERLLEAVCARFRLSAQVKGLSLTLDCPPSITVTSDPDLLRRVVSNLIDNAIKFTSQGTVAIAARQQDDKIVLTISDSGSGILPADQRRIFEDLEQLGNPQRDRAFGIGLGLGIVRRLTRLLGIEYVIESQPGRGTTIRMRLPPGGTAVPVVSETVGTQPGLVARRVLVLDDDASVRAAYEHALTSLGCQVLCVAGVDAAMSALPALQPEVALVDYRLAEPIDGLAAIACLRTLSPRLAAVIVSADTSSALREEAAKVGVPVLRKPVTDATLAATINDALHEAADGSRALAGVAGPAA